MLICFSHVGTWNVLEACMFSNLTTIFYKWNKGFQTNIYIGQNGWTSDVTRMNLYHICAKKRILKLAIYKGNGAKSVFFGFCMSNFAMSE